GLAHGEDMRVSDSFPNTAPTFINPPGSTRFRPPTHQTPPSGNGSSTSCGNQPAAVVYGVAPSLRRSDTMPRTAEASLNRSAVGASLRFRNPSSDIGKLPITF